MNATKAILIVCSVLVATLLGGLTVLTQVHRQQRELTSQLAARDRELAARARELATLKQTLTNTTDTAQQLETKLTRMTEALVDSTRQLSDIRTELEHRNAHPDGAVPPLQPPVVSGSKEDKSFRAVFPELLSKSGRVIARQQEFSTQLGRSLIFKDADGKRLRCDLEELHPAVLAALGIDPQAAQQEQRELDAKSAQFNAAAQQAQAAHAAALAQAAKEQREQAAKSAQLEEERRRANLEESLRLQAAEADRLRATATLRAADAALYQAMTPSVVYNTTLIHVGGGHARPNNQTNPPPAPSPTVAPPFTPNTVYMVRSNKVELIRSPKGLPLP